MGRGRKPEPTALKRLRGNPGKRPLPANEPQPDPTCPRCPAWLDALAKAKWRMLAPQLHAMGVLTLIDGDLLVLYCESWSQLREATKLRNDPNEGGKWIAECRHLKAQMLRYKAEMGMTPSSRVKLIVSKPAESEDPLEKLLKFKA